MRTPKRPFVHALLITGIKVIVLGAATIFDWILLAQYVPVRLHALVSTMVYFLATFLFGEAIFIPFRPNARKAFGWMVVLYLFETLLSALLLTGYLGDAAPLLNQPLGANVILFIIYAVAMYAAWYDVKRLGGQRYSEGLM